jgi:uncharacterized protein YdaU (DUF1376 family)
MPEVKVSMYMRWYVGDYLQDTDHLSLDQHGAYSLLLMKMWQRDGFLPHDHDQLARLCRVSRDRWDKDLWPALVGFFLMAEGGTMFTQKRLLEELEAARTRCEAASEKGRRGAHTRWSGPGSHGGGNGPATGPGNSLANGEGNASANSTGMPPRARGRDPSATAPATEHEKNASANAPANAEANGTRIAGQGSGVRSEISPRLRARDRSGTCTGHDLLRWYAEERAKEIEGALPWQTPVSSAGKAETFAEQLGPDEVRDVRQTMQLHFRELKGGGGKAGALEDPTFGFGCWSAAFTRLREKLHGTVEPVARPAAGGRTGATDEAKAAVAKMTASYVARHGG